jgi:branched-chain amino acid transport system ATP-binding protein
VTALLSTERLTRTFGSLAAVLNVDFTIGPGELRSIIGPNGAGKTTFFRLVSGEMRPTAGVIRFKGEDITGLPQHRISRLGIVKSYQITSIFPHLTVRENVRVAAQAATATYNFWSTARSLHAVGERADAVLAAVGLANRRGQLAAHLSHGEKRHLEIGIALAADPELLLLDEPTAGMSPEETEGTMRLIAEIARGRTVVLVEHNMKLVMRISHRITVFHQGEILAEGTPDEIRANERVQQVYLGGR